MSDSLPRPIARDYGYAHGTTSTGHGITGTPSAWDHGTTGTPAQDYEYAPRDYEYARGG